MSASKESPVPSAITKIDEAIDKIRLVRNKLDDMRNSVRGQPDRMREIDDLDDKLHDALAALGQ